MDYRKIRKYLFIAFLVALGARLYINFFVPGFIITFTAIILGISLYFNEDINPLILGLMVAVVSPALRYFFEAFAMSNRGLLLAQVYPDVFFYITYGLVFYFFKRFLNNQWVTKFYWILFFSDFLSNLVELLVRTHLFQIQWPMIQGILIVALGRSAISMLAIFVVVRYTSLLMRQEHEKRYQYLMMLSSRFKSEIYFLHKNMNQIEDLVALSHKIKGMTQGDQALRDLTLDLSQGVHEIKKDYIRAVRGLEEIYDGGMNLSDITLKDLFTIIDQNTSEYLRSKDARVTCQFKCKVNVQVKRHFYMMSILRNLVNNAIEACGLNGKVYVYAQEVHDHIEIYVRDNGSGIKDEDKTYIFNTGYSTKFNDQTGDINRGLGLTLVKEMVEDVFKGHIDYETSLGQGTSFIIILDKDQLERG